MSAMTSRWIWIPLLLAGCATRPPAPATTQIWESPAAEFPPMCMLMQADGALAFKGGFLFYNPGTWRADGGQLTITLGGDQPFPADLARQQLRARQGALVAADPARRALTYQLGPATDHLGLGGFNFYRAASCHAD